MAGFTKDAIVIDGKLDNPVWQTADKAINFIQYTPQAGAPSTQRTEVSVLYDNTAVYIGAKLFDNHPDSIMKQLSSRDDLTGNADNFSVTFDTYNDKQNATSFCVTAAGVQADNILKFDVADYSWNAAWYSKVILTNKGWILEMKIPYSALRFPKKPVQLWGINFTRYIRRTRETSNWNYVQPTIANQLSQEGELKGVHDIVSPVRLSFLPYISAYLQNYGGVNTNTFNGGMDIKYGLDESFTLDMTLVPDFGQTIYDNQVLNLSPIEVKYDERRYFFTEGLSLFNKDDLFYTRRVGGTPIGSKNLTDSLRTNEIIFASPSTSRIYNAVKVSGRNKHKLGIGFFNAITGPTTATLKDTLTGVTRQMQTSTLTNYNVLVLDQALKNNSYISFVNTNVTRHGDSYNADVSALLFKFANKKNTYGIDGSGDVSNTFNGVAPQTGFRYYLDAGKQSGNYTWLLSTRSISDKFNPNDLGYLARNNITSYVFDQAYNIYQPVGPFARLNNFLEAGYYRVYSPNVFMQVNFNGSHNFTFRNYLTVGTYWSFQPVETNDYLEPRTPGRFYISPTSFFAGGFISSDYRKKFALDININNSWFGGHYRNTLFWDVTPRYRFTDKFSMVYDLWIQRAVNDVGYVDNVNDSIYLGTRNVNTITSTLDAAFIFTNTMSLKLDARHYWSQAVYSQYSFLGNDGRLNASPYNTNHNVDFNTFNVYLSFVWQYTPGSEMSLVYQNSIYSSGQQVINSYTDNLSNTLQMPQSNSLSLKVIYYLDYLYLKKGINSLKG